MGNLKFGPWLLTQTERGDTTGALARAWRSLKDARGYNRHTTAKAIRELLSSSLGEDWQALRGDESMSAAEAEWKTSGSGQTTIPSSGSDQIEEYYLQGPGGSIEAGQTIPGTLIQSDPAPAPAVLMFNGNRYELTPGRTYTLSLGPVLREGEPGAAPVQTKNYAVQERAAAEMVLPDGHLNWAALYAAADHDLPDGVEIVDSGWAE